MCLEKLHSSGKMSGKAEEVTPPTPSEYGGPRGPGGCFRNTFVASWGGVQQKWQDWWLETREKALGKVPMRDEGTEPGDSKRPSINSSL